MDVNVWISGVTAFAGLVTAWLDARKAGLELDEARTKATIASDGAERTSGSASLSGMTISNSMLEAYVEDLRSAESRFVRAINDPRYTPAQLDQEEEIARVSVCTHLKKISEFNGGKLPAPELEELFSSWRCE